MKIDIPLPIQVVIDDVGWWAGKSRKKGVEPWRNGMKRDHVIADYEAIASLGRQLNMRPQAAFAICEWDKENILGELPSATWMGKNWDNSRWVGPWLEEAAEVIRSGREYMELTLHAVGHEYWQETDGEWRLSRAEWHDAEGNMRPREQVLARLKYFGKIMEQHQLGEFPNSFVPCGFIHRFAPQKESLAALLRQAGIDFISTQFEVMHGAELVQHERFGFDNGVITVDRGTDILNWSTTSTPPSGTLKGPICGMHWQNMLHEDPERNEEIVTGWVNFLRAYEQRVDRLLAPDTACFTSQLLYHTAVERKLESNTLFLDFSKLSQFPRRYLQNEFVVKVSSTENVKFETQYLEIKDQQRNVGKSGELIYRLTAARTRGENAAKIKFTAKSDERVKTCAQCFVVEDSGRAQ